MNKPLISLFSANALLEQKVQRALRAHREFDKGRYHYDRQEITLDELKRLNNAVSHAERMVDGAIEQMREDFAKYEATRTAKSSETSQLTPQRAIA